MDANTYLCCENSLYFFPINTFTQSAGNLLSLRATNSTLQRSSHGTIMGNPIILARSRERNQIARPGLTGMTIPVWNILLSMKYHLIELQVGSNLRGITQLHLKQHQSLRSLRTRSSCGLVLTRAMQPPMTQSALLPIFSS